MRFTALNSSARVILFVICEAYKTKLEYKSRFSCAGQIHQQSSDPAKLHISTSQDILLYFTVSFFALIQESDDLEESGSQPPKKHHHYFWDPYETAFMTSEPAYTVDKYARIYFPVTFAVLNSIYWIVYAPDKVIF